MSISQLPTPSQSFLTGEVQDTQPTTSCALPNYNILRESEAIGSITPSNDLPSIVSSADLGSNSRSPRRFLGTRSLDEHNPLGGECHSTPSHSKDEEERSQSYVQDATAKVHGETQSCEAIVLDITQHPQDDLIVMLSSLLGKITTSNDELHSDTNPPKIESPLLAFHARNVPSISIQAYLSRILKYCPMSSDIFLSLLVYFDRMSKVATSNQELNLENSFTSTKQLMGDGPYTFSIDSYNVHRLVITGIVVASKFCSDVFYTNSRYAKVGGLPLSELNHLEFQFLLMNDFRLMIPVQELQRYGDQLLNFWRAQCKDSAIGQK